MPEFSERMRLGIATFRVLRTMRGGLRWSGWQLIDREHQLMQRGTVLETATATATAPPNFVFPAHGIKERPRKQWTRGAAQRHPTPNDLQREHLRLHDIAEPAA